MVRYSMGIKERDDFDRAAVRLHHHVDVVFLYLSSEDEPAFTGIARHECRNTARYRFILLELNLFISSDHYFIFTASFRRFSPHCPRRNTTFTYRLLNRPRGPRF
jgi:hypothetical protein